MLEYLQHHMVSARDLRTRGRKKDMLPIEEDHIDHYVRVHFE